MEFRKYNSIENSYQEKFINNIISQGHGEMEFIVQEKVHGANLSFITNGTEILTAKRTEILPETDPFYNVKAVKDKYTPKILALHQTLAEKFGAQTIHIFGELFGGNYPHPDVPKDKTAVIIQKGVFYTPSNDFFAFDILIDNETYLGPEVYEALFGEHGFVYAKTLFKGSLHDCLAYPNKFVTTIPALYGLPELENNVCEGVVIRSVDTAFMYSDSRVIIKNKNEEWAEKKSKGIDKAAREELKLGEQATFLCDELSKLINANRMSNVVSKIGEVTQKDFGKHVGLLSQDALEEFQKSYGEMYGQLEKEESKAVKKKFLSKQAMKVVKKYFQQ